MTGAGFKTPVRPQAAVAHRAEHLLGRQEVGGSRPLGSSGVCMLTASSVAVTHVIRIRIPADTPIHGGVVQREDSRPMSGEWVFDSLLHHQRKEGL